MVKSISKRTTPLCFLPSGRLVCYKDGQLIIYEGLKIIARYSVFNSFKERVLGRSKLLFRLLRLGVRTSISIDEAHVLLSVGNMIYEYDFEKQSLSSGFCLNERIRPLVFTTVSEIDGFDKGIVFGGYLYNMGKKPVSIYRRKAVDDWEVVYTFPQGTINHIHNIIVDQHEGCLWVFTGDFLEASAIWKVTDNFKSVERFVGGDQKYRGCIAYTEPTSLIYATDAPFAPNHIAELHKKEKIVNMICEIPGSCIYGCVSKADIYFSTTVEGEGKEQPLLKALFERKRGPGIKDDYVHLYKGNVNKGFIDVYKDKKDIYPFSFQFGVYRFPAGFNKEGILYFQPVATRHYDLDLCIYEE